MTLYAYKGIQLKMNNLFYKVSKHDFPFIRNRLLVTYLTVAAAPEDKTIKNDSVNLLVPLFKLLSDETANDEKSSGGDVGGEEEDDSIVSEKTTISSFKCDLIGLGHMKVKSTNQSNPSNPN